MTSTINLHRKQGEFVGTRAHHAAYVGGIGSGKSMAGAVRALLASQGYIGSQQRIPVPNLGVVTAPTYQMLKDATVRSFLDIAGDSVVKFIRSPGDMMAIMSNGSEVLFRSTHRPDQLRGPSIAWWFGDEAALYEDKVYQIMIGRLRQFGRQGYLWLATTPRGRNWLWRIFVRDNGENPDYRLIRSSSHENIFLDGAILEAWEAAYTGDFAAQELAGEFVAFEGLIYSEFDRHLHVSSRLLEDERVTRYICGVDWGYANPGVILLLAEDGDGRLWLKKEFYQRQRQIDEWVSVAQQLHQTFNPEIWFCDPSNPDFLKKFREGGLRGVQAADNQVTTGIQHVKARLARQGDSLARLVVSSEAANTIDEFESYQWAEDKYGKRDVPLKTKDHAMDALRYAVMGLDNPRVKPLTASSSSYI